MIPESAELSNKKGIIEVLKDCLSHFRPPERLLVSEWADKFRVISDANAMPGPWRTANAPYQKEPMDCIGDKVTRRVSLMWSGQVGKTECINNGIGYSIAQDPKSVMMMHPTQSDLKTWSETKLEPLLNDTPCIKDVIAKPRGRDGVNNALMKSYPGGFLMFSWSGSTNTMRGRSAPIINCDEIDGYTITKEGDAVQLLWQRAATFGDRRKLIETSTPTIKGFSRIEKAFLAGDQRYYYVPCPHCDNKQRLKWGQVKWDKDEEGNHLPETAHYVCEHCGCIIEDKHKPAMLRDGEWIASRPFRGHASFHLNELYSPWRKFSDIVQSFLDKKAAGDEQSFINLSLAETYEEKGEQIDDTGLLKRREHYAAQVPMGGVYLTAGVDTQVDRLECEVVAWGVGEESWSIAYAVIYGDPDRKGTWDALDDFLDQRFKHESGVELSISATAIDSGGLNTQSVYNYCKKRRASRRFAIKGKGGEGIPIVSAPSKRKSGKKGRAVELFSVGTDQSKTLIYKRLGLDGSGPGRCHFPDNYPNQYNEEYFKMLTAEKCITRYVKGFPKREWVKTRPRNEALDVRVYSYNALLIVNPNLKRVQARILKKAELIEPEEKLVAADEMAQTEQGVQNAVEPKPKTEVKRKKTKKRRKRQSFINR